MRDWLPDLPIIDKPDYTDSPYFSASFKVQVLEKKKTPFCELEIVFNPLFGNMMFIDGEIQISEADFDSYHAAMLSAGDAFFRQYRMSRVLVIGDGDGGFTRMANSSVDIVERDRDIILAGEKYFGAEWRNVRLHEQPLDEFMPCEQYDVVLLAIDDGFNCAAALESRLDRVAPWVKPRGKLVAQVGTDLDPKHPKILERYTRWAQSRRFLWTKTQAYVRCYFCHQNFFAAAVSS